jgi:iron complex outermembrane receptor protein
LLSLTPALLAELTGFGNIAYKEEQLDNFELGHKQTWFDNRLRTTLAVYRMKWSDGQIRNTQFISTGQSVAVITNSGKVNLSGAEFEASFAATRNWNIDGTLGYASSKLVQFVLNPNGLLEQNNANVSGNTFDQTPKLTLSFSPSYRRPMASGWDFNGRVDYLYQSKTYTDTTNLAWTAPRGLVNARLGVVRDDKLKIELFANNLFNDDNITGGARTGDGVFAPNTTCPPCFSPALPVVSATALTMNTIYLALPEKRTVGLRASYDF